VTFAADIARVSNSANWWVEIEGLPVAYGTFEKDASWFSARPARERFTAIKPFIARGGDGEMAVPQMAAQRVDHVEGRTSMGAFAVALVDVDDTLAALTASWRVVAGDVQDGLYVTTGAAAYEGDSTGWPATGVAYFVRESATYTVIGSGAITYGTRGAYRSPVSDPALRADGSPRSGALLTPYPRRINGRRVWVWLDLGGGDATEAQLIFRGTVHRANWEQSAQALVLECDDEQAELKRPIFRDIGAAFDSGGEPVLMRSLTYAIGGGVSFFPEAQIRHDYEPPAYNTANVDYLLTRHTVARLALTPVEDRRFADNQEFKATFEVPPRGAFDFVEVPARPIVYVARQEVSGKFRDATRFTAGFGVADLHPLEALLSILLSTGTGTNKKAGWDGGVDQNWDCLPAEWGLGVPAADVDVAGIEALIRSTHGYYVQIPVAETPPDAREWIVKELLKPFGFYLRPRFGGLLGVGSIRALDPGEIDAAPQFTLADVVRRDDGTPAIDGPTLETGEIVLGIRYTVRPEITIEGELEEAPETTILIPRDVDSIDEFPDSKIVEIDSSSRPDPSYPGRWYGSARSGVGRLGRSYIERFGRPASSFSVEMPVERMTLDVGDVARWTLANMPSVASASRGLTDAVCEVAEKQIDLARRVVKVRFVQSGLGTQPTRFLAPACDISAWSYTAPAATGTLTVAAHGYSASGGPNDAAAFVAGDIVRIYSYNLATRFGPFRVFSTPSAVATTITLTTIDGGTPALSTYTYGAGDVLMVADYAECTVPQRARFAFVASKDERLPSDAAPHRFA
jgi:hypothetical protein